MLPSDFWKQEYELLLALLLPRMESMAITGVDRTLDALAKVGLAFDNALAHEAAAAWARAHTDEILQQLQTTTEGSVGQILENWIATPEATRGQLEDALRQILDDNAQRAEMIATTESTRAFAAGENLAYREAGLPGMVFPPPGHPRCRCWTRTVKLANGDWVIVWQTNRDELVCERTIVTPWGSVDGCGKLNNVVISEGPYLGKKLSEIGN